MRILSRCQYVLIHISRIQDKILLLHYFVAITVLVSMTLLLILYIVLPCICTSRMSQQV
jgi:phage shock protein PspC (stress-responsive transcriptional regulator)